MTIISCSWCGKEFPFSKSRPQKIFCSKNCRISAHRKIYYEKVKKGEIAILKLRFEIFKRDNFNCQYCGRNVKDDKVTLHIDHIIPRKEGGKDIFDNLTTSCSDCNYGKRDVLLEKKDLKSK